MSSVDVKKKLELVHLQITRNCNLRCWFCGQWGRKGFFSNSYGADMTFNEWTAVINSLIRHRENTGDSPSVILWGGEPLVSPVFERIAEYLKKHDFEIGMVTNGVLIDRHFDVLRAAFKIIYVSVDGPAEIHDSIRGKGVFEKVAENIKLLRGSDVEVVIMTVITPELLEEIQDFPHKLIDVDPSAMLLHDMIFLFAEEAEGYSKWLKDNFGLKAKEIYSWKAEFSSESEKQKAKALKNMTAQKYPFPVKYLPHGEVERREYCLSPFKHLHVTWNGNVVYCTDFYDFSAGNVKDADVIDIFNNELSEKFRQEVMAGRCVTCNHCAWKNNENFCL